MDTALQQAELAIIGACLLEEKIPDEIRGILLPEMFTSSNTINVWKAITETDKDNGPITVLTVVSRLPHTPDISTFLVSCVDTHPSASGAIHYARMIARGYVARIAARYTDRTSLRLKTGDPVETVLLESSQKLLELHQKIQFISADKQDAFSQAKEEIDHPTSLIPLNFSSIDQRIGGGLVRGEVHVIAGRPGEGKTTTAISRIPEWADDGYKILYISKEMPKHILVWYLISLLTQIPRNTILKGQFNDETRKMIEDTLRDMTERWKNKVVILDDCWSMEQCESAIRIHRPDIIIDDFIQLSAFKNRTEIRHEILSFMSMYKRLAKELHMCPIIISQLNRDVEKRLNNQTPQLSDLAESGALEQLAANVFFVQYPYQRNAADPALKNILEIIIGKARYGERGKQRFTFIPEIGAIIE